MIILKWNNEELLLKSSTYDLNIMSEYDIKITKFSKSKPKFIVIIKDLT